MFKSRLSTFSFPQIWTTWKSSSKLGSASRTSWLTWEAPRLPPITIITGFASENLQKSRPACLLPFASSSRIGVPVKTALFSGSIWSVSGKLQQILEATGIHNLLASPGVISDSCMMQGIFRAAAARTTGTLTKPPLEKTMSGAISFRYRLASA